MSKPANFNDQKSVINSNLTEVFRKQFERQQWPECDGQ